MGRKRALAIVFGLVTPLFGCGAVDSGVTFLPESFRQPAPKVPEIEQPPDVHLIVRSDISAIFVAARYRATSACHFPCQPNMADGQRASKQRLEVSPAGRSARKSIW